MLFTRPSKAVGLDIGTHAVKAIQMSRSGGRLRVDQAGYALVDRHRFSTEPVLAQADAVREALRTIPHTQALVVGALPGQTVVIRHPRLAQVSERELGEAIEREAAQNIPYERNEVFLDWTPLDTVTEAGKTLAKVLLVAARYEVIETRVQIAHEAEVQYGILGVDSLALADAAEACDFLRVGESVALINLGATTTSIHFVRDSQSNFIRDVSWGARDLIQAIARSRRVETPEAERILVNSATERDAGPPPLPESPPPPEPSQKIEDPLAPLDDELGALGGATSAAPKPAAPAGPADQKGLAEILSTPLSRLVSEIRRSFDYYEHQLYEQSVERLILSGGVAHLPVLRDVLRDELGVAVELADPTQSALVLGPQAQVSKMYEHPSQFMVAVGLAARGMAEL